MAEVAGTVGHFSNSVHLQVCIVIFSQTNQLLSELPTEEHAWDAEKWVGVVLQLICSLTVVYCFLLSA